MPTTISTPEPYTTRSTPTAASTIVPHRVAALPNLSSSAAAEEPAGRHRADEDREPGDAHPVGHVVAVDQRDREPVVRRPLGECEGEDHHQADQQRARLSAFYFRSILALALMIGFYLLALAMSAALLYIPYATIAYAHRISIKLSLLCVAAAYAILKGCIFVRSPAFQAPGPIVTEGEQPELFHLIREVAASMKTRMPDRVYFIPDVNAFVAEIGGFFGFGSRRIMGIGLGLLHVDNVSQLKATLAHEFGHYAGGDTRVGGLVYRTRLSIGRVLDNLNRGFLSKPFELYAKLFLRVSHGVSREQELAADRAAVNVAGLEAHLTGLACVARGALLFDGFIRSEVAPLIDLGFCSSNLFDGFQLYHAALREQGTTAKLDALLHESAQTASTPTLHFRSG